MTAVALPDLLRDVRHLDARAAPDLADWLVALELQGKADRTLYGYPREIALLLRTWPDLEVHEFQASHIEHCLAMKPRQSRHQTRAIFNSFFKWLKAKNRIAENPMEMVEKIKQPPRRPRDIFSEAERALLESLPCPDGPLLTLMFGTGLRKTECINLRRDHIDLNRERLIVHNGKGGKDRIVPLFLSVQRAINELDIEEQLCPGDYLWYVKRGKRRLRRDPVGDTTFDRWWAGDAKRGIRGVLERAGVRYLNIHQTRHTFGHWLRELGLDIEERKEFMGHEDIRTTEKYYGRVTIEDVAAKIREMAI